MIVVIKEQVGVGGNAALGSLQVDWEHWGIEPRSFKLNFKPPNLVLTTLQAFAFLTLSLLTSCDVSFISLILWGPIGPTALGLCSVAPLSLIVCWWCSDSTLEKSIWNKRQNGKYRCTPAVSIQRVPQLLRPDQSACVGRGRWHQVPCEAASEEGVWWLPGPEHHRGPDPQRRDGRLVQPGSVSLCFNTSITVHIWLSIDKYREPRWFIG